MLKTFKNISLYSLGEILNKSIQFLLLPLYTNYLTPADYGKLELTYLYGALLVIFYGFIIENGYGRFYFSSEETNYRDQLFGTSFFFKLSVGVVFLAFSVLFAGDIAPAIFYFDNGSTYIILISVSVFIKSLAEIPLKNLIVRKKVKRYVINNTFYLLVTISSTVYFIVNCNLNVLGVLYGQILGATVQLISLLATEWRWAFLRFSFPLLKDMLYFSVFMIPTQLASFVTYWSNRFFLQEHVSLDDLGNFSFGYKIASIISIILTGPLKKAISPEVYELISNPEECKNKIRQFSLTAFLILTISSLTLSVFSKELIYLMADSSYASSFEVVFLLSMSYSIIGVAGIVVLPLHITQKTWFITITWGLSSLLNLVLNYLFIQQFGVAGASYATLLTFLFILVLYFIFSELSYQVRFEYKRYILIFVVILISYYSINLIEIKSIILTIFFKSIALTIALLILFKLTLTLHERQQMLALFLKRFPGLKKVLFTSK